MKYRCESEILAEPPTGIRGAGALRGSAWKANSSLRGRRLKGIPLPFRTPSTPSSETQGQSVGSMKCSW